MPTPNNCISGWETLHSNFKIESHSSTGIPVLRVWCSVRMWAVIPHSRDLFLARVLWYGKCPRSFFVLILDVRIHKVENQPISLKTMENQTNLSKNIFSHWSHCYLLLQAQIRYISVARVCLPIDTTIRLQSLTVHFMTVGNIVIWSLIAYHKLSASYKIYHNQTFQADMLTVLVQEVYMYLQEKEKYFQDKNILSSLWLNGDDELGSSREAWQ